MLTGTLSLLLGWGLQCSLNTLAGFNGKKPGRKRRKKK